MRRARVDVARDDVRLEAITGGLFGGPRMVDRVEHVEQLHGFVAAAKRRHRHDDPHRGVGILAAVLPHARRIALDVPRLLRRPIERWAEEQQRLRPACDQRCADRIHRAFGETFRDCSGQYCPGLRNGVDSALVVLRGAQRTSVVVIDTDPLRDARADFVRRFADRPYFFVRAATPQVLLDEVDRVL